MAAIQSVRRAFMVLRAMNERPVWSLQELAQRTGLAKSTLHRTLAALQQEHYVRSHEGMYGHYELTSAVTELSKGVVQQSRLVDVAAPILISTTKRIKWPLSVATVNGSDLRVDFCTMPYSPYAIRPSSYGRRYGLFDSALGRAYFSFCDRDERRILFDLRRAQHQDDGQLPPSDLRYLIRQTRKQGYGVRRGNRDSESSALAVPIFAGDYLLGALAYSTFSRTLNDSVVSRFAPILQETARRIGDGWLAGERPPVLSAMDLHEARSNPVKHTNCYTTDFL
ncbi:MAG: helix-turn-helix domain-containing protein [Candidimonas sp.]|nr:helix-turn-helix domain-containing protein [Candidimonas sp.]